MQSIQTALVFFMLVNGSPEGQTQRIDALTADCKTEMLIIDGINRVQANKGITFVALCEQKSQ